MGVAIHQTVMDHLEEVLTLALKIGINPESKEYVSVVKQGPLYDEPKDPAQARIYFGIFENDPDDHDRWHDRLVLLESPMTITMARRFTVKGRLLLEGTRENLQEARALASIIKGRAETAILAEKWTGIRADDGEFVSRGVLSRAFKSHLRQSGGPPDSYDFRIKFQFEVWTTKGLL